MYRTIEGPIDMTETYFFIYILKCSDHSYYIGNTNDLEIRLDQHYKGSCGSYTSTRLPVVLVYQQQFPSRTEAVQMEQRLKGWTRAKKEALIGGRFDELIALSKKRFR